MALVRPVFFLGGHPFLPRHRFVLSSTFPLFRGAQFLRRLTEFSRGVHKYPRSRRRRRPRSSLSFPIITRHHRRGVPVPGTFLATGDAFSNYSYRHRTMLMNYDGDRSEDLQSEEVQSAYRRDSDIGEEMVISEEQTDDNDWSWVNQGKDGDPLAESVSSLHTTQQVLESEIQKLSELGKELEAEESTSGNKDQDVIVLPSAEVDMLELNEKMEHLEQKLKEASNTIREKDLRLSKLQKLISTADSPAPEEEEATASVDQLVAELERHLLEKLEAEVQCLVMLKARQSWQVRAEDRAALEEQEASPAGATMLLKLRETEGRIVTLKEQVDRLEVREKELHRATEALRVQSRTFKVSLFGLVQLVMLCFSLKVFFARVPVPFDEVVPT
ncbi:hypothetical protein PAHAL_7G186200 [Panicum hallii]|uniref:Uncharacterized protein n=1 Tax=Panicum hallii TaxID=206008 RepID=A0A2S3I7I0_9POAL|nr:uncharacterized protein LOC112901410 isoform X2 [Panicum hallii]PAN38635.1 hypothetical protein PAHAL_7G186200 [Panicum hallii]